MGCSLHLCQMMSLPFWFFCVLDAACIRRISVTVDEKCHHSGFLINPVNCDTFNATNLAAADSYGCIIWLYFQVNELGTCARVPCQESTAVSHSEHWEPHHWAPFIDSPHSPVATWSLHLTAILTWSRTCVDFTLPVHYRLVNIFLLIICSSAIYFSTM